MGDAGWREATAAGRTPCRGLVARASLGGLVLAALLGGCAGPAEVPPAPPAVLVTTPSVEDVSVTTEWVGTLGGLVDAQITAQVTGYLLEQNYREGTLVKKGQRLFTIDPRPFAATLENARAALAQATANQVLSQLTLDRVTPLVKDAAVSQQEFDNVRQQNLANLAAIDVARAAVLSAEINLGFTRVLAPIDGLAGIRQANIGDLVGPQGTVHQLTTVVTTDPIYAVFPVSEAEYLEAAGALSATAVNEGPEPTVAIELTLSDGSRWPHPARFSFANNRVDPATGTIVVKALVPNPENTLRPGQYVRVRAATRVVPRALVVPAESVWDSQGQAFLAVIGADQKAAVRQVTLGPPAGKRRVVTSGLAAGETVVVEGGNKLRNGMPVTTAPWAPAAPVELSRDPSLTGTP